MSRLDYEPHDESRSIEPPLHPADKWAFAAALTPWILFALGFAGGFFSRRVPLIALFVSLVAVVIAVALLCITTTNMAGTHDRGRHLRRVSWILLVLSWLPFVAMGVAGFMYWPRPH